MVIFPPTTGPVAVPMTPAVTHVASPRASPDSATSSSKQPTSARAPPTACTQRAPISTSMLGARAQAAEATAKAAMPTALRSCGRMRA